MSCTRESRPRNSLVPPPHCHLPLLARPPDHGTPRAAAHSPGVRAGCGSNPGRARAARHGARRARGRQRLGSAHFGWLREADQPELSAERGHDGTDGRRRGALPEEPGHVGLASAVAQQMIPDQDPLMSDIQRRRRAQLFYTVGVCLGCSIPISRIKNVSQMLDM